MSFQTEEIKEIGIFPGKTFCCNETIVDYKFKFKNTEFKVDIYIAYEADGIQEIIKVNRKNYQDRSI